MCHSLMQSSLCSRTGGRSHRSECVCVSVSLLFTFWASTMPIIQRVRRFLFSSLVRCAGLERTRQNQKNENWSKLACTHRKVRNKHSKENAFIYLISLISIALSSGCCHLIHLFSTFSSARYPRKFARFSSLALPIASGHFRANSQFN